MAATLRRNSSLEIELTDLSKALGTDQGRAVSPFYEGRRSNAPRLSRETSFLFRRPRAKSLEDVPVRQTPALRGIGHRGSVRGTFTTEFSFFRRLWRMFNKVGRDRRDYSLFVFHKNTKFRKNVKKIAKSWVFKFLMGVLVLLHSVALGFYQPAINGDDRLTNTIILYVTVLVTVLYTLEAGLNIIAYGLIQTPKAYLKNAANVLDVTVILFAIIYIPTSRYSPVIGEVFASLMALKLVKIFALSPSVRFILKALAMSFAPLFYLSILTFIVITFLALIGIQLFSGSLHGGCFANYVTPGGRNKSVLVSEFPCDNLNMNKSGTHICPYGSTCSDWDEGPLRGIISFDNMGVAYLTVFQAISLEGWIQILTLYDSAMGPQWVWAYFVMVVFFGSIFILNLWTGVLTSVFIGVSDREEKHGKSRKLKEKKRIEEDLGNYNDWLRIAAEMDAPSDTGSILDRRHSLFMWSDPMDEDSDEGADSEEDSQGEGDQRTGERGGLGRRGTRARKLFHFSRRWVRKLVKHRYFLWFVLVLRAVNLILLMSLHFPSDPIFNAVIYSLNYVFSVLYLIEFLMRIGSLSRKKYLSYLRKRNSLHLVEIVLSALTVLELVVFVPVQMLREAHISVIINAIWCLKLIMFAKHTRSWGAMREIIRTVFQLLPSVLSLLALVVIFLFVFTILGIRLFGDRLSNTGHVEPNFDDFYQSFLLVFQLMTSEDWNNLLFSSLDHWIDSRGMVLGGLFAIYFVIGVAFGSFILLSVFLAMSVDKLSEVRSLESDSAAQSEQSEKIRNEKKQQIHDLKKEPHQVKRRTIRQAMKYLSDNPADRTRQLQESKKKWRFQFSLPLERIQRRQLQRTPMEDGRGGGRDYLRSTSAPHSPISHEDSATEDHDVFPTSGQSTEHISPKETKVTVAIPKLRNPLRLMRRTSGVFEKQQIRLGGVQSKSEETPESLSLSHPSEPARSPSFEQVHKTFGPKLSLDSADKSTDVAVVKSSDPIAYERTQSCPADSPITTVPESSVLSDVPKLDTIEEVHDSGAYGESASQEKTEQGGGNGSRSHLVRQNSIEVIQERPRFLRSFSPSNLALKDDQLTSALHRGGSLEDIHPFNVDHRYGRSASQAATSKLKEKGMLLINMTVWMTYTEMKAHRVLEWIKDYVGNIQLDPQKELAEIPNHSSFFILAPDHRFREFCYKIVCSKSFHTVTFVAVLLSSLLLTLEVPIGVEPTDQPLCSLQMVMLYLDCFFVLYFLVEMGLKMTALGVILHRGSYLRGFFNILDFIIAVTNVVPIIAFIGIGSGMTCMSPAETTNCIAYSYCEGLPVGVNILRVLRVLRPLRAIRVGGLYLVVTGLVSSVKSMGNIFFMITLVLVVFAVAGVQFFRGQFWYCTDPTKTLEVECSGSYFVYDYTFSGPTQVPGLSCPQVETREWRQRGLNFDNIGAAILTLFSMMTIEGWQSVMYDGINAIPPINSMTSRGQVSGSTTYRSSAIFFIIYMVVMALILIQLFTGFVIVTFQEVGVKTFRDTKLDRNQRNCLYFSLTSKPLREYVPKYSWHRKFHETMLPVVNHYISKSVIAIALIINCILLASVVHGNKDTNDILYYINIFFTVFFAFEAVMKIIVLTPPTYFRNFGNVFEFLIVVGTVLELIIQLSLDLRHTFIASSFRVLRLLTFIPSVRLILWTVIQSLEIFPWVGYLLMIVFFMYTVVGMQVFGTIRRAPIDESDETEITVYNNFANFPQALLVMIRMATGENWQDIMLSSVAGQRCELGGEHCGSDFAYFFFTSFYFLSSIMILNLLVAIVIDNFDYIVRDKSILGAHQLSLFVKLWAKHDPEAEGKLHPKTVLKLLRECNPPVGWGKLCPELQAYKKMARMNMPIEDGKVSFNATLFALVRTSLKIHCKGCPECAKKCNIDLKHKLKILFPRLPQNKIDEVLPTENDHTVGEEYAALLVQRVWRGYILRRRKVIEIFQCSKKVLKAGLRTVPDTGPDLLQRNSSDFEFEVDLPVMPIPRHDSEVLSINTDATMSPSASNTIVFAADIEPTMQNRPHPLPSNPRVQFDDFVPRLEMADAVSELSFTSAYSNPVEDSTDTEEDYGERLETTV